MVSVKTLRRWSLGLAGTLALGSFGVAAAQDVQSVNFRPRNCKNCPQIPYIEPITPGTNVTPGATVAPPAVNPDKKDAPPAKVEAPEAPKEEPRYEPMVSAALGDTSFAMSAAPQMMGDFAGSCLRRTVLVPTTVTQTIVKGSGPFTTTTSVTTTQVPVTVCTPVVSRDGSGFKIGDNESPIPMDRVFFSYNYFRNLQGMPGSAPGSTTVVNAAVAAIETTTVVAPVDVRERLNLHREIFGIEKTFLGGDASIEVRLPIYQSAGEVGGGFAGDHFGDLTALVKFALINNPESFVFSAGLAVTIPTGAEIIADDGRNLNSVLLQPFVGFLRNYGEFYVQGFSSVVIPTESRDTVVAFNDLSVGYNLYRGTGVLRSLTPVLEGHLTTPLQGHERDLSVPDIFSIPSGVHLGLGARSTLSLGINVPVTGPSPYDVEALAQLNYRY